MFSLRQILTALALVAMLGIAWWITPSTTRAEDQGPWRIGFPPWIAYDIVLYAEESGIFDRHGVDVELIRFDETSDVARAVMNGDIDAGFTGLATIILNHDGTALDVVLVTNVSAGADGIIAHSGTESLSELRGKRIACKQNATNRLILSEALELAGLSFDDIEIADVCNATAEKLLRAGQVDAAVLWEPELSRIASTSESRILHRTSDLESAVIDTLVVRSDTADARHQELLALRRAWFDLLDQVERRPGEVFELLAIRLREQPDRLSAAWRGIRPGDPALNARILNRELDLYVQRASSLLAHPKPLNLRAIRMEAEGGSS